MCVLAAIWVAGVVEVHGGSVVRGPRFETRHASLSFVFFNFHFFKNFSKYEFQFE